MTNRANQRPRKNKANFGRRVWHGHGFPNAIYRVWGPHPAHAASAGCRCHLSHALSGVSELTPDARPLGFCAKQTELRGVGRWAEGSVVQTNPIGPAKMDFPLFQHSIRADHTNKPNSRVPDGADMTLGSRGKHHTASLRTKPRPGGRQLRNRLVKPGWLWYRRDLAGWPDRDRSEPCGWPDASCRVGVPCSGATGVPSDPLGFETGLAQRGTSAYGEYYAKW
jgi:hypothetical protein